MTIDKFDVDARRHLTLDEKVDLILDRFLGNPLRGIVGQIELISMLERSVSDVRTSNADMFHRMQRLEEIIERQNERTERQTKITADDLLHHRQEANERFTALYFWLSVVGLVAIGNTIVTALHVWAGG